MIRLPATTYAIAGLAIALTASLSANGYQLYRAGKNAAAATHAVETVKAEAEIAALQNVADVNKAIAELVSEDYRSLIETLDQIAERGQRVRTVYRQAAAAAPLAEGCGPGQQRMDAINDHLGGTDE